MDTLNQTNDQDAKKRMIDILKSHGIQMIVGGCGCLGSPWVVFKYQGKLIYDSDDASFDSTKNDGD